MLSNRLLQYPKRGMLIAFSSCAAVASLAQAQPVGADNAASPATLPLQLTPLSASLRTDPSVKTDDPSAPSSSAATPAPESAASAPAPEPAVRPVSDGAATTPEASNSPASSAASAPASSSNPSPNANDADRANPWKRAFTSLVDRLVQRGNLTKEDSQDILSEAQQDVDASRTQAQEALATPAPQQPQLTDGTVHVSYVPETVKDEIREEVKEDVLKHDQEEQWEAPNTVAAVQYPKFRVFGDVRVRGEADIFPSGNDDSLGAFPNFNSINTGSMFDLNANTNPAFQLPSNDVNQDRDRMRLRVRFGTNVDIDQGFTVGVRVGTGSDDSPVTENQTLGGGNNGQSGDFGKYQIWLDRGFIKYELGGQPYEDFSITAGRFDNPFFGTSMIWADDIGFDGVVLQGKYQVVNGVTPFLTAGAFPVFNTDFNFASNNAAKFQSEDKWLYAAQTGTTWKINQDFDFKGAVAYYDFENIQGKVSSPYIQTSSSDEGDTADSRPSFAQNGNTYIAVNNVLPNPADAPGETPLYEYFGLATPFHELALTAQLDVNHFDPFHIWVVGEFVKNVAFDRNAIINNGPPGILSGPQNNLADGSNANSFYGGDTGYDIRLNAGKVDLEQLWDWNASLTYRYVETDAVVDGFTDSDFGTPLTGTNLKGFILGANLALSPRVWTSLHWFSADAVAGPTYHSDVIQLDVNAKF